MALIELEKVSRHYVLGGSTVRALDEVSLRIEAGEMLAIMGVSGSGKSTLMNLLGCLDKPSTGRLTVDGRDLATLSTDEMAELRRETFGFIFQRYHLLSHLDAVANVELPAIYAGQSHGQRRLRATALLQRLGLGDRLDHRPNALSGGQQQRVSIARALMNGGRIILADEPTGALDTASGAELLALLGELNAQGHTVILVTHDPVVAAHARRIVELRDGRIVRDELSTPTAAALGARTAATATAPDELPPVVAPHAISRLAPWREAVSMSLAMLAGNRLRGALSMLGISIGIAAVVTIMALGEGMQVKLRTALAGMGTPVIQLSQSYKNILAGATSRPFVAREAAALQALPGVAAARLQRSTMSWIRHGGRNPMLTIESTGLGDLARIRETVVQGRDIGALDLDAAAPVVVLGEKARDALFLPGQPVLGERVMVGEMPLTVVGVTQMHAGLLSFSMPTLYVPNTTYSARIDNGREAPAMRIYPSADQATEPLVELVRQRLRSLRGGNEDFTIDDSSKFERMTQGLLTGVQTVLTAIAGISLLVGGVGVMNIMLVAVAERTREIGIRMAIGARPSDIRRQFLIESVVICGLGALVGLVLPWLAALIIHMAKWEIELIVGWQALALALGTSTTIGLLFGNLPANMAARLSPVTALARD
jgi:macrolide transport system ATP-binding/permease protein